METLINPNQINGSLGANILKVELTNGNFFGKGIYLKSNSSYIDLGSFTLSSNSFYIETKVTLNNGSGYIMSSKNSKYFAVYTGNQWGIDIGNGTDWSVTYGNNRKNLKELKEDIFIRFQFDGTKYSVLISKDKNNWYSVVEAISSQLMSICDVVLGCSPNGDNQLAGLISIKDTKIVNDYLTTPVVVFDGATAVSYTINGEHVELQDSLLNGANLLQIKEIDGYSFTQILNALPSLSECNKFNVKVKTKFLTSPSNWLYFFGNSDGFSFIISPEGNITVYINNVELFRSTNTIDTTSVYDIEIVYNLQTGYVLTIKKNGVVEETLTNASTAIPSSTPTVIGAKDVVIYNGCEFVIDDNIVWSF